MKHTKTATLLALTGSSILAISHASAALVSVNLQNGQAQGTITNPSFGLWSQGSNVWNTLGVFNTTSAPLQDSSGATTGITFTTVNVGASADNWTGGSSDALVNDGFYTLTAPGIILTTTISGLALNTDYKLLVYHADDYPSEAVTVNNTAGSDFTGSLGATGYVDAFDSADSDFWYFSSINSGATGELTIRSGGGGFDTITGFQLEAIPEPSTALLGGLGMLALLRRRR